MPEANLVRGPKRDREQILQLHADYIDANARFDWQKLEPIWSAAPEAVFFNLNGHTYKGREHWIRLWKFYGQNVQSSYWTPFDVGGVVSDDMAVVWWPRPPKPPLRGAVAAAPAKEHPLGGGRVHPPRAHGIPQGGGGRGRRARVFFRGGLGRAPRRGVTRQPTHERGGVGCVRTAKTKRASVRGGRSPPFRR